MLENTLTRQGIQTTFVNVHDIQEVEDAVQELSLIHICSVADFQTKDRSDQCHQQPSKAFRVVRNNSCLLYTSRCV